MFCIVEPSVYLLTFSQNCIFISLPQPQMQICNFPNGDTNDTISTIITWLHFLGDKTTKNHNRAFFHPNILKEGSLKKSLLSSLAEIHVYWLNGRRFEPWVKLELPQTPLFHGFLRQVFSELTSFHPAVYSTDNKKGIYPRAFLPLMSICPLHTTSSQRREQSSADLSQDAGYRNSCFWNVEFVHMNRG